ncbi:hypothetical protein QE152_g27301 [Popillia japonica]|uniref:Uncharacterized protein n=1 Tax=Popillia japonica TaxID=7064 RepID=A0AAW1JWN0_POPJA
MAKDGLVQLVAINDINVPVTSIFNRQSVNAKVGLVQLVDINDINVPVTSIFNRQSVNAKVGGWCISEASKELRGVFDAAARLVSPERFNCGQKRTEAKERRLQFHWEIQKSKNLSKEIYVRNPPPNWKSLA